jgi:hypothetical protein
MLKQQTAAMPVPFSLYKPENKRWLLPLFFVFSAGWALEMCVQILAGKLL